MPDLRRPAGLALAAVLLLASGALAGCGGSDSVSPTADERPASGSGAGGSGGGDGSGGAGGTAGSASDGASGGTDSSTGTDAGGSSSSAAQVTVPVYFVGDTPAGPRLYREFHRVAAGDPVGAALDLAASGDAGDPDYRTLLPDGDFDGTGTTAGDTIEVPLPDDSWTRAPSGLSPTEAVLAIQQLVYTAQGVLQSRAPVVFTDGDGNATQILGVASEDGFTAAPPLRTLALVNITEPAEGQHVGDSLTASGVASSFEATVPWEVRDASGDVVLEGAATAEGWMDKLYPWSAEISLADLSPGTYTFVARTDDPSDGEGPGPTQDTRTFVVG